MHQYGILRTLRQGLFTAALLALLSAAQADTVYNVLPGQNRQPGGGSAITPANDVRGPADLITINQTWNGFSNSYLTGYLKTSTGPDTTVTFTASGGAWESSPSATGSRIFDSYVYLSQAATASFGGLNPASTYDLYVLVGSFNGDANTKVSVTQTAGTGLTGTFHINNSGMPPADPLSFRRDTNSSDVNGSYDYALLTGLTPSAGGALSFSYPATYCTIAGYQLVEKGGSGGPGPLHHFDVTATSPQTSGAPFSITVTAKDASGITLTTDNSTLVTMTSSGNAQFDSDGNGTFGDNSKVLTNGTFTITTKDSVAESLTLTATGGGKTGSSSSITVNAGGPAPLDHFDVTATSPQTVGSTFSVTVTAKDGSGNALTTDNSTVVTMTSSGSAQFDSNGDGTFGDSTQILTNGTFTINTKDNVAEGVTLIATAGDKNGTSSSITVNPIAPTGDLVVVETNSPLTLASGSYSYGHVWLGNDGSGGGLSPLMLNIQDGVTLSCTEFLNGFGVTAIVNQSGGSVTVTGTETGNGVGSRLSMGVYGYPNIGSYNLSGGTLTATAGLATFGADDYGTLTISGGTANLLGLLANWNNKGSLTLSSGTLNLGAQGIKPQNYYGGTPVWTGTITFSGGTLKLNDGGPIAVNFGTGTVDELFIDGEPQAAGTWGGTGSGADHINTTYFTGGGVLTVRTGPGGTALLDHFDVTAISPQTAGETFMVTVTAKDASGNTVTGFNGTVAMSETGGGSGGTVTPPTSSAFVNGVRLGQSVTLSKAGTGVTLTVSNSAGSETGSSGAFTVQSQFAAWGGGVAFDTDANSDGVANGLAWLLGAANSSANSASLLPKSSRSLNGDLVMSFRCLKAAMRGSAIPYVQYSKDLGQADLWIGHQAAVPESSTTVGDVIFTVTSNGDYDDIIATIPASAAASGGKLFGRLLATE